MCAVSLWCRERLVFRARGLGGGLSFRGGRRYRHAHRFPRRGSARGADGALRGRTAVGAETRSRSPDGPPPLGEGAVLG